MDTYIYVYDQSVVLLAKYLRYLKVHTSAHRQGFWVGAISARAISAKNSARAVIFLKDFSDAGK